MELFFQDNSRFPLIGAELHYNQENIHKLQTEDFFFLATLQFTSSLETAVLRDASAGWMQTVAFMQS